MDTKRLFGLVLLGLGLLALVYKGFTYTKETHRGDFGPFHWRYDEKEHVDIPGWLGVIGIVAGAALLVIPTHKAARA